MADSRRAHSPIHVGTAQRLALNLLAPGDTFENPIDLTEDDPPPYRSPSPFPLHPYFQTIISIGPRDYLIDVQTVDLFFKGEVLERLYLRLRESPWTQTKTVLDNPDATYNPTPL